MYNLKDIRNDFDTFVKTLKKRNIDIDLNNIKKLDDENRKLIQEKEMLGSKLSNQNFVENAPKDLVETQKEQAKYSIQQQAIKAQK